MIFVRYSMKRVKRSFDPDIMKCQKGGKPMREYIVETKNLKKYYQMGANTVKALDGVDFHPFDSIFLSFLSLQCILSLVCLLLLIFYRISPKNHKPVSIFNYHNIVTIPDRLCYDSFTGKYKRKHAPFPTSDCTSM